MDVVTKNDGKAVYYSLVNENKSDPADEDGTWKAMPLFNDRPTREEVEEIAGDSVMVVEITNENNVRTANIDSYEVANWVKSGKLAFYKESVGKGGSLYQVVSYTIQGGSQGQVLRASVIFGNTAKILQHQDYSITVTEEGDPIRTGQDAEVGSLKVEGDASIGGRVDFGGASLRYDNQYECLKYTPPYSSDILFPNSGDRIATIEDIKIPVVNVNLTVDIGTTDVDSSTVIKMLDERQDVVYKMTIENRVCYGRVMCYRGVKSVKVVVFDYPSDYNFRILVFEHFSRDFELLVSKYFYPE